MLNNPPSISVTHEPDPFMAGALGRPLWLAVDDSVGDSLALRLLEQLGSRPSARVLWTSRPGPDLLAMKPVVPGRDFVPVHLEVEDEVIETAIPSASAIAARSELLAREHGVSQVELERLLRLAALARTWKRLDRVVTNRLLTLRIPSLDGLLIPHCVAPEEAVALLGLSLRAHGDFSVWREGGLTRTIGAARFYRAVAIQSIPGLDAWLTYAAGHWLQSGQRRPLSLLDGIATRVGRALRARDYLQVRFRAHDCRAVWEEVLFFFDVVLLQTMGALDQLARLLHYLYSVPGSDRTPSWRRRHKDGWVAALAEKSSSIAALAQTGQQLGDVVDIVAELRNAIHEAPLSDEVHDWDDAPQTCVWGAGLIALTPSEDVTRMVDAVARRGGPIAWGISDRRSHDGAVLIDPGLFAEQALRATTAAVALVLSHGDLDLLKAPVPRDLSYWVPDQREREHSAALVGLDRGGLRQDRATFA